MVLRAEDCRGRGRPRQRSPAVATAESSVSLARHGRVRRSPSPRRSPRPPVGRPRRRPAPTDRTEEVPERIPHQVYYNSRTVYVPPVVFERYAQPAGGRHAGVQTGAHAQDRRITILRKSSSAVLAGTLVLLLVAACVVIVNRTGVRGRPPTDKSRTLDSDADDGVTEMPSRGRQNDRYRHAPTKVLRHNPIVNPPPAGSLDGVPSHGLLGTSVRKVNETSRGSLQCATGSCSKEGERIASLIDPLLNPCDNFYEYVCANWAEEHPIPKGGDHVSYQSHLVEYVEKRLDGVVRAVLHRLVLTPMTFNVLSSEAKAVLLRNACMEVERLNDRGLHPLKEALELLHLPEWPASSADFAATQIEDVAGALAYRLGLFPLVTVAVERDPENPSRFMITLDEPSREVMRKHQFSSDHDLLRYENTVRKAFDRLDNRPLTDLLGSAVLGLEDEIAQALLPFTTAEEKLRHYAKLPVSDLPRCTKFRWQVFLNHTFQKIRPVFRHDIVLVKNMAYMKKLVNILEGRQRRTIINYLGFKATLVFSLLLPPSTEGDVAKLYGRVLTGQLQELPRWRACLRMAEDAMPFAYLAMYGDLFAKDQNVPQLRSILEKVKDLLGGSIEDIEWMNSRDAAKELEKLKRLQLLDFVPVWLTSEEKRNVFYESVQDIPMGNLLRSLMNAKTTHVGHRFQRLLYAPSHVEWSGSVFDVTPTYEPLNNSLYVPMAAFAEPMGFDSTDTPLYIPRVLKDVAGLLIGAVSALGALYDSHNAVRDWWTSTTKDAYRNHSECVALQFNLSIGAEHSGKGYSDLVSVSNVLDSATLPFLLHMYQRTLRQRGTKGDFVLANLPNVTTYQLFFAAYTTAFCENSNEAYVQRHLASSSQALAPHRVNVPLWNSDDFGSTFRCPRGSAMNPSRKCKFWRFQ